MKIVVGLAAVISLCVCCAVDDTVCVTNVCAKTAACISVTNAQTELQLRQRCEAFTKSGNRCKRNAAPGGKLCRQHGKILKSAVRER